MKFELFNEETNKVWRQVSGRPGTTALQFELDIYKKLLNFFQVGDFYYIIFNIASLEFDFVSPLIETVLGYAPAEFNMALFMEAIHPDDRHWLLTFETKAAEFLAAMPINKLMKYKVRYDFRLRTRDGNYVRVLHQSVVVEHDDNGLIARTLSVQTDISHIKKEGKPVLSFIGMEGEPSYIDVDTRQVPLKPSDELSRREKEVLLLLIAGKLSKEIAEILNISKNTVDNHRKNMLRKNMLNTTAELVAKAIKDGWV